MGKIYRIMNEKTTRKDNVIIHTLEIVSNLTGEVFTGTAKATCDKKDKFDYGYGASLAREKALRIALTEFNQATLEYLQWAKCEYTNSLLENDRRKQIIRDMIDCNC